MQSQTLGGLTQTQNDRGQTQSQSFSDVIESDRVEGTTVYNRQGERLGTVKRFLVEKRTGKARYAELAFGGFLGLGEEIHPLPWENLSYDEELGGYVVDLDKEKLRAAPYHARHDQRPTDPAYEQQVLAYYGVNPVI